MKLFLSSYRAGDHVDRLKDFLGNTNQMATITNAKDYKSAAERQAKIEENFDYWLSVGLEPVEIDLRPYFHKPGAEELLDKYDFIWLAGGNAFLLRRALKYTGIDEYLKKRVREGSLIYGGESAGAILAAPTLLGSEDDSTNEDDPKYIPEGYDHQAYWDGLGFLDYVLVPHYKSPEIAESIEGYVSYLKKHRIPHKTIREEEALIVDGDRQEFLR